MENTYKEGDIIVHTKWGSRKGSEFKKGEMWEVSTTRGENYSKDVVWKKAGMGYGQKNVDTLQQKK